MNKHFSLLLMLLCSGIFLRAQDGIQSTGRLDTKVYTCLMHPDIHSSKQGKCPKCGMTLVLQKTFVCPMHPDQISNHPGKCPKCGMEMQQRKTQPKKPVTSPKK